MRRQKDLNPMEIEPGPNLSLLWTEQEYGTGNRGLWFAARALLWVRNPRRLIASVAVHGNEYRVHMRHDDTLADRGRRDVEKHLQSLNLKRAAP